MNEMVQNTGKFRKIVKEQLWVLVDKTESALKGEAMKWCCIGRIYEIRFFKL